MTKSEIHRMLRNPIYTGDFRWLGKRYQGSHTAAHHRETFEQVQAVLGKAKGMGVHATQQRTPSWVCSRAPDAAAP